MKELDSQLELKTQELKRSKQELESSLCTFKEESEKSRLTIKQLNDDLYKANTALNEAKNQCAFESEKSSEKIHGN